MERRRAPRADAKLSMRVEGARDESARTQLVTESQNISASGVYCLSDHFLAPLSKVNLTLVLPKFGGRRGANELVKCDGIVVRCEPRQNSGVDKHWELACMFSGLDAARREMLADFVVWRNLQALRAAARAANAPKRSAARPTRAASGTRAKPARARTSTRSRTATSSRTGASSRSGASSRGGAARRRTVH
jgi:PilZ domain-containing protein